MNKMDKQDQFLGCLLGSAIGDAIGYPVEFLTLEQIKKNLGPQGVTGFDSLRRLDYAKHPIGTYSDDTQMTLATLRGLLRAKNPLDLEEVMNYVSQEYAAWYQSPDNDRAPGLTCLRGTRKLSEGRSWKESGVDKDGCGAAMRASPVGLLFYKPEHSHPLILTAEAVGSCTHANQSAVQSGVVAAKAVAKVVEYDGRDNHYATQLMHGSILGLNRDKKLQDKLKEITDALNDPDEQRAIQSLGHGWKGHEAVAMALYAFLKSPKDYRATILRAANIDGDSDSVASIAGAISGAYNGASAIPKDLVSPLIGKEEIIRLGKELYSKSQTLIN
jgi:ADP-ribosylglycohydrolase